MKNKLKRILAFVIAFAMVFSMMPGNSLVSRAEGETSGTFMFDYDDANGASVLCTVGSGESFTPTRLTEEYNFLTEEGVAQIVTFTLTPPSSVPEDETAEVHVLANGQDLQVQGNTATLNTSANESYFIRICWTQEEYNYESCDVNWEPEVLDFMVEYNVSGRGAVALKTPTDKKATRGTSTKAIYSTTTDSVEFILTPEEGKDFAELIVGEQPFSKQDLIDNRTLEETDEGLVFTLDTRAYEDNAGERMEFIFTDDNPPGGGDQSGTFMIDYDDANGASVLCTVGENSQFKPDRMLNYYFVTGEGEAQTVTFTLTPPSSVPDGENAEVHVLANGQELDVQDNNATLHPTASESYFIRICWTREEYIYESCDVDWNPEVSDFMVEYNVSGRGAVALKTPTDKKATRGTSTKAIYSTTTDSVEFILTPEEGKYFAELIVGENRYSKDDLFTNGMLAQTAEGLVFTLDTRAYEDNVGERMEFIFTDDNPPGGGDPNQGLQEGEIGIEISKQENGSISVDGDPRIVYDKDFGTLYAYNKTVLDNSGTLTVTITPDAGYKVSETLSYAGGMIFTDIDAENRDGFRKNDGTYQFVIDGSMYDAETSIVKLDVEFVKADTQEQVAKPGEGLTAPDNMDGYASSTFTVKGYGADGVSVGVTEITQNAEGTDYRFVKMVERNEDERAFEKYYNNNGVLPYATTLDKIGYYRYYESDNGGKVRLEFHFNYMYRMKSLTINGKEYGIGENKITTFGGDSVVFSDLIGDSADRSVLLRAFQDQDFGFTVDVDKADDYVISFEVIPVAGYFDEYQGEGRFGKDVVIGNFLWFPTGGDAHDTNMTNGHLEIVSYEIPEADANALGLTEAQRKGMINSDSSFGVPGSAFYFHSPSAGNDEVNRQNGEAVFPEGTKLVVKLVPDYGYQLKEFSVNGERLTPLEKVSTFEYIVGQGNFHFGAEFEPAVNKTECKDAVNVSDVTIENGENATDSGTLSLTVKDAEDDASVTTQYGDAVVSTIDLTLVNEVKKSEDAYWETTITAFNTPINVNLSLDNNVFTEDEYSVVRNHNGKLEILNATYDKETGNLSFDTSRFSAYTIVKKQTVVPVTGVSIVDNTPFTLTASDEKKTLTATVAPETATNKTVSWSSDAPDVATVDEETGEVTAVGSGTATITVTTEDGSKTDSVVVTVDIPVQSVQINETPNTLRVAGATTTLTATVNPSNAKNKNVTWTSSNLDVATVDADGVVTAVGNGTATITVTTEDGSKMASVDVTVDIAVQSVQINQKPEPLTSAGATTTLTATVNPSNAKNKNVTWSSNNTAVATVDEATGEVTAVGNGTATITVTTADGSKKSSVDITVEIAVQSVQINETPNKLTSAGATTTLTATVNPSNAKNKNVTWSSNNTAVATVDEATGEVTAVGNGTATITVTTKDGSKTDSVEVTVEIAVQSVKINEKPEPLTAVDATTTLTATVAPSNAKNKTVTWSSDNTAVATVNETTGVVTAVGNGIATITVTTEDGSKTDSVEVTVEIAVQSVTINATPDPLSTVGATTTLTATVAPANANNTSVTWSSDNTDVATVNETTGVVTAEGNGTATITATANNGVKGTVTVEVKVAVETITGTPVTETPTEVDGTPGTIVTETNVSNTVKNSISIADFNTTTAKAELDNQELNEVRNEGADAKLSLYVTSLPNVPAGEETKIETQKGSLPVNVDATTDFMTLDISMYKTVADKAERLTEIDNKIKVEVSVPDSAILSDAPGITRHYYLITVHDGVASIEYPTFDAASKKLTLTMDKFSTRVLGYYDTVNVSKVTISGDTATLTAVDQTTQLTATIEPNNASIQTVRWTSSNPSVATVDATGKVTAVGNGTTTIKATSLDRDESVSAEVTIKVSVPVASVEINKTEATLTKAAETLQLTATVLPAEAENKEVTWTSGNPEVATVDATGKVTAIANGTTTITVVSKANATLKAECKVTVNIPKAEETPDVTVSYHTHIQTYGDSQGTKTNGQMAGTSGQAKRLENIWIKVEGNKNLGIQYTTHCQSYGWLPWTANGEINGTSGEAKRLEAIKIQLTGADKDKYDVYYRVHAQSYGWLAWVKNGEPSGTAGMAKRLEGIQVVVVKKGEQAPGMDYADVKASAATHNNSGYISTTAGTIVIPGSASTPNVMYKTHVQTFGWQDWKTNGVVSGTSGQAKRLEGINIKLTNCDYAGGIRYMTHIQKYGWSQGWKTNGAMSGTSGEAKRLEAIRIELTGEMAEHYDIYYRVHAQTYGWLAWAKNGESAGTEGLAKRLEGIQIILVPKGEPAPSATFGNVKSVQTKAFIKK